MQIKTMSGVVDGVRRVRVDIDEFEMVLVGDENIGALACALGEQENSIVLDTIDGPVEFAWCGDEMDLPVSGSFTWDDRQKLQRALD